MNFRRALLIGVLVSLCFAVPLLFAQQGSGGITGQVTDSQGAVVLGAKVVATNVATQVHTNSTTNSAGIYNLLDLIPGTYSVEASAENFKKSVHPNILVQVSDRIGLDFKLEVGGVNETITVTAEAPQLRTEDAQSGEVVNESMIESLVQLNRDPLKLLTLSGNVQGDGTRAGWNLGAGGGIYSGPADTRINGGRAAGIEYLIDGVPATGGFVHNVVNATPTTDDVQEFKVITNGISSEYGRLSGGVVEVSTKSGTDKLHGQLFEYNKNSFLNANSWTNDNLCAVTPKDDPFRSNVCNKANFRQNRFGFALGGPVVIPHLYNGKNRTFWFANAEWLRESTSGNDNKGQTISDFERSSIPNPFLGGKYNSTPCPTGTVAYVANPTGNCADFTDIGDPANLSNFPYANLYDPFAGVVPEPLAGVPDPANVLSGRYIPISENDPIAEHYIALFDHENFTPQYGGTGLNYTYRDKGTQKGLSWNARIDHVINDKQRIYGRFDHNTWDEVKAGEYRNFADNETHLDGGFGASLHYDYTISPTLIFDFTGGGNYSPALYGGKMPSTFQIWDAESKSYTTVPNTGTSDWGFPASVTNILGFDFPAGIKNGARTEGTGHGLAADGTMAGQSTGWSKIATTDVFYTAAFTKIVDRHTLKFGYEARRYYDNINESKGTNPQNPGDGWSFMGAGASQFVTDHQWDQYGQAEGMGAFLWGLDTWAQISAPVTHALESNYYAAYLQDNFKVNKKLTLNLGVRWETETGVTERHNNLSLWDPLASPPFHINPGYDFNAAVAATGVDPTTVRTPTWASSGEFAPGAIVFVNSPEHRARTATDFHPWNFSPRLGFAYQVERNTVVRGSFGMFYLPTGGNLTSYGDTPGVNYEIQANNTNTQTSGFTPGPNHQTISINPFGPNQIFGFGHSSQMANYLAASHGQGTGGVLMTSHMPHEFDWSLGVQHQFPQNWLVELTYSGNSSTTLQAPLNLSRFPKDLYVPANANIYNNGDDADYAVASPTAGQISNGNQGAGQNWYTGDNQRLGMLEYMYPYFGPVMEEQANVGVNHYESGNLRLQKRFSSGLQLLFNYTYAKALDNVGSGNQQSDPTSNGFGSNGKPPQGVDTINSVYGLGAGDVKHRISAFYDYKLPFGRGRKWMNSPHGAGNVLEYAAGGWEFSGQTIWHTGIPIFFSGGNSQPDSNIDIFNTFPTLATGKTVHDLVVPGFSNPKICAAGCTNPKQAFVPGNLVGPNSFTYGTIPATEGFFRQPGQITTDISILKSFPVMSTDGSRYFQLRLEGQNIFNHPQLGNYNTYAGWSGDTNFGLITGPNSAVTERQIQISGRLVF